jgi:hypothetical protein
MRDRGAVPLEAGVIVDEIFTEEAMAETLAGETLLGVSYLRNYLLGDDFH